MPDPYRATRDVDVLSFGAPDDVAIRALITQICAEECPQDGLRFDLADLVVEEIRRGEEYAGKRARFVTVLGKARIRVQVDFGFGDALPGGAEEIEYPTLLDALPAPRVRAYPRDAAIAEKINAMVSLGTRNSRMKDFHDVWALSRAFEFDDLTLLRTIAACFERRRTPLHSDAPDVLSPAFYDRPEIETRWRHYVTAGSILVPPPAEFACIGTGIISFLAPVRESIILGASFASTWEPAGPWR